jgi:hypothetical protein
MKHLFFTSLLSCFLVFAPLFAKEIANVTVKESLTQENTTLNLQGAGVRDKFFIDLYVAGLYTQTSNTNAASLIQEDAPMALTLHITSSLISSEKMEEATREGFENATHHNTQPLHDQIETFINVFKEPIQQNDVYTLVYLPVQGVRIYKNGTLKQTIAGLAFKQALFGIWLGEKPAQESLKQALLGN